MLRQGGLAGPRRVRRAEGRDKLPRVHAQLHADLSIARFEVYLWSTHTLPSSMCLAFGP